MSYRGNASKLPDVGTTIFTVMSRRAAEQRAVNVGQGFPDYPIDPDLAGCVADAIAAGFNQYAPMEGNVQLRAAIAAKIAAGGGRAVDPESELTVSCGGTESIYSAIQAVVGAGDEAIVFDPAYDAYDPAIRLAGGRCIHIPLEAPHFRFDWQRVRESLSTRTRLIIINNPHNPATSVATAADLDELAGLVRGRPITVLADEVYEHVLYDGRVHQSVMNHPELRERSYAVYSFGKTLSSRRLARRRRVLRCQARPVVRAARGQWSGDAAGAGQLFPARGLRADRRLQRRGIHRTTHQ